MFAIWKRRKVQRGGFQGIQPSGLWLFLSYALHVLQHGYLRKVYSPFSEHISLISKDQTNRNIFHGPNMSIFTDFRQKSIYSQFHCGKPLEQGVLTKGSSTRPVPSYWCVTCLHLRLKRRIQNQSRRGCLIHWPESCLWPSSSRNGYRDTRGHTPRVLETVPGSICLIKTLVIDSVCLQKSLKHMGQWAFYKILPMHSLILSAQSNGGGSFYDLYRRIWSLDSPMICQCHKMINLSLANDRE